MKLISYNVNGIRSAMNKGFVEWLKEENPDVIGLQEIKAQEKDVDPTIFQDLGYELYWFPAVKKGYSGVAIFTKVEPKTVKYGMGLNVYGYMQDLKRENPTLVLSGDYNICHKPIDIHNPNSNKNSSGFLPEERAWMDKFTDSGFIDTFRHFNPAPHQYTWWSFRANSRAKNLGWRIDYHMATRELQNKLKSAVILSNVKHSDHCPIVLEIG